MKPASIDKLAFIDLKDNKVLVTLSIGKSIWYIPGGKREAGETDQDALIREVKEELSVNLIPETISYYGTFEAQADGKSDGTMVRMTCYVGKFIGQLMASNEIAQYKYVSYSWKNKTSSVDQLIFDDLKSKGFIV